MERERPDRSVYLWNRVKLMLEEDTAQSVTSSLESRVMSTFPSKKMTSRPRNTQSMKCFTSSYVPLVFARMTCTAYGQPSKQSTNGSRAKEVNFKRNSCLVPPPPSSSSTGVVFVLRRFLAQNKTTLGEPREDGPFARKGAKGNHRVHSMRPETGRLQRAMRCCQHVLNALGRK